MWESIIKSAKYHVTEAVLGGNRVLWTMDPSPTGGNGRNSLAMSAGEEEPSLPVAAIQFRDEAKAQRVVVLAPQLLLQI